jgi:hypothetical protein
MQKSGGSQFEASTGKQFTRPYLKKPFTKKGLVELCKVLPQDCKKKERERERLLKLHFENYL